MNAYSLWVNLCSIMGADVQNLHRRNDPEGFGSIIFYVSLGRSFHSVGAMRSKSYEKNFKKKYCVEIVTNFTKH